MLWASPDFPLFRRQCALLWSTRFGVGCDPLLPFGTVETIFNTCRSVTPAVASSSDTKLAAEASSTFRRHANTARPYRVVEHRRARAARGSVSLSLTLAYGRADLHSKAKVTTTHFKID